MARIIDQGTFLLITCIGALILLLALLILLHQNATATKGYRLRRLERERSNLLRQEEVLRMHVAEAQSLAVLQSDKRIQAMLPVKRPLYGKDSAVVARE